MEGGRGEGKGWMEEGGRNREGGESEGEEVYASICMHASRPISMW